MIKKLVIPLVVILLVYALLPLYIKRGIIHNFANIDDYKLFQNRTVATAAAQPWNESEQFNTRKPSGQLLEKIEANRTVAFLVVQNDSIKYEQYWKGYSDTSYSGSFSMAKSITSLLIGIAMGDGKIKSLDQPVSIFIHEFKHEGTDTITIRDLLAMSGGFNWKESYWNIFGKTANSYYGVNLEKQMTRLKSKYPAGEKFRYSSCETQILGLILERIYNKPLSQLASERIWKPIGAERPAKWSIDNIEGTEKAFCCFNSNARDFARLGKLVLQQGKWDSQQIVPAAYISEATSPATWLKNDEGQPVNFYGYQFWIAHYKGLTIPYFRGILGQFIFVIPEKNAVVVRLGEYVSKNRKDYMPTDIFTYLDAALEVIK